METYDLEEVMSGAEEAYLWVTLGFTSALKANDVIHIVCATAVDAQDRETELPTFTWSGSINLTPAMVAQISCS